MTDERAGDVGGAVPEEDTYVHGATGGSGPGTTQAAATRVGRGRGGGERRMVPRSEPRSYYGRPVVKPPVWTWEIPTYFFTGGVGGASAALGLVSQAAGNPRLARSAWIAAFAGITVSPLLLISDLGKPMRFINMLRVFKVTSPMNVGSWLLTLNGIAVAPAAAYALAGRPKRIGPGAQVASGILGLPVATYTATLISNTSVPVWSEARWHLPFSFAASAAASAGAAAAMLTPPEDGGPARRLAIAGGLLESVSTELMKHHLGDLGQPYEEGAARRLTRAAETLTVAGAGLLAASARRSRKGVVAGAAMILAGSACERWAVFKAGFQSAEDPKYTVGPQRERLS